MNSDQKHKSNKDQDADNSRPN